MFEKTPLYKESSKDLYDNLLRLLAPSYPFEIASGSVEHQILEVIAYEQHKLDSSFNEIEKKHLLQYFQLLGKRINKSQEEQILATLEKVPFHLFHKFESFTMDGQRYELQEEICLLPEVENVYFNYDSKFLSVSVFLKGGNSYFEFPTQKGSQLLFLFRESLKVNQEYQLYFQMKDTLLPDDFTFQSIWEWEYYSEYGWCPLHIIKDECKGFSQSGFFNFTLYKAMREEKINSQYGYVIRATLCKFNEVVVPTLETIIYNAARLYQQYTFARYYECFSKQLHSQIGILKHDVFILKEEKGLFLSYDHLEINFDQNEKLLLVYQDEKVNDFLMTNTLSGVSEEKVFWNPEYEIKSLQIFILYQGVYYPCPIYEEVDYIVSSEYGCYINYEDHCLCFGNGHNFLVPEEGSQIFIYDLVLHNGNIIHSQNIDEIYQEKNVRGKYLKLIQKATKRETLEEAKQGVQRKVHNHKCIKNKQEMLTMCQAFHLKVRDVFFDGANHSIWIELEERYSKDYLDEVCNYLKKYTIVGMQIKMIQKER